MRAILTSGSTRGEDVGLFASLPLLLYCWSWRGTEDTSFAELIGWFS
jgi:hypothetical protein